MFINGVALVKAARSLFVLIVDIINVFTTLLGLLRVVQAVKQWLISMIGFWVRMTSKALITGLLLASTPVLADEKRCLAEAMYFEARDQGWRGMLAVGVVIRNRVNDPRYPDNICSVVKQGRYWKGNPVRHKCQFSYWCDGKPERPAEKKPWTVALDIARMLISSKVEIEGLEDATHYHATSVQPSWASVLKKKKQIGEHIFYANKKGG